MGPFLFLLFCLRKFIFAMFGSVGYPELILLGVVAILLFGKRLPEVARSLGGSYREFRKSLNEIKSNFSEDIDSHKPAPGLPDYHQTYDDQTEPAGSPFEPPVDDEDADKEPRVSAE